MAKDYQTVKFSCEYIYVFRHKSAKRLTLIGKCCILYVENFKGGPENDSPGIYEKNEE